MLFKFKFFENFEMIFGSVLLRFFFWYLGIKKVFIFCKIIAFCDKPLEAPTNEENFITISFLYKVIFKTIWNCTYSSIENSQKTNSQVRYVLSNYRKCQLIYSMYVCKTSIRVHAILHGGLLYDLTNYSVHILV